MNKTIFQTLLFLFMCCTCSISANLNSSIELRAAGFFHTSKLLRDIYGKTGACYEIEIATRFSDCSNIEIWANYDQFSKRSSIHGDCCGKTTVDIYNASLGLNYLFPLFDCFGAYLGVGGSFARIDLKNKGCCIHEKESKFTGGLVLKSGIIYHLTCNWFVDVFADYFYQPVHFKHRHVDIGGVKVGGGIGLNF